MIIGLTGGIASGKTAVSDYLASCGYQIVDADVLARQIMLPPSPILGEVRAAFGESVFFADGSLDRKALGQLIFYDSQARARLDAITHPAIMRLAIEIFAACTEDTLVFFVAPLLYESGMDVLCDRIWLVHADEETRQERLMQRESINAAYAKQKMNAQMSEEERLSHHPHVINNDGDLEHLYMQVKNMIKLEKSIDETKNTTYNKTRR